MQRPEMTCRHSTSIEDLIEHATEHRTETMTPTARVLRCNAPKREDLRAQFLTEKANAHRNHTQADSGSLQDVDDVASGSRSRWYR